MILEEFHEGNLGGCTRPPACPFHISGGCAAPTHVCPIRRIAGTDFIVKDVAELILSKCAEIVDSCIDEFDDSSIGTAVAIEKRIQALGKGLDHFGEIP